MAKKKQKIDKPYSPTKTTQTIHVREDIFGKISDDKVKLIIENEALNYKLKTVTIKCGKDSIRKNPMWVKWVSFGELSESEARSSGYKGLNELEKELKKEKSGLRSNSPISLLQLY